MENNNANGSEMGNAQATGNGGDGSSVAPAPMNGNVVSNNGVSGGNGAGTGNANGSVMNGVNGMNGMAMGGVQSVGKKKANGTLIAIIVGVVAVLIVVIVALVVVLMKNNNGSKSQDSNKGGSHYEKDDEKDEDKGEDDGAGSSSIGSMNCLGFQFEKQAGYDYICEDDGLGVSGATFAMYAKVVDGLSYYVAQGSVDEIMAQFSKNFTINGHEEYTAANGRRMLVFDVISDGNKAYIVLTPITSSAILIIEMMNDSGNLGVADLETTANILGASTITSKVPEGETEGSVPEIDWKGIMKAPELKQ